ncbi:IS4 family transposase [Clostridium sporogenes]|uniref:IS4 family transposase n=2 Tax=Clostridium sporogenes TaxID=1509 RepID=UPI003F936963
MLIINIDNYNMLFQKFIDLIDWKSLKIASFKLNIDYLTIENHLKALIYFQIAELDYLRDIHEFMQSKSDLTQIIKGVSLGSLSNYNNKINYTVLLPVINSILIKSFISIPANKRIEKFGSVKLIDSSTISTCITYFKWAEFRASKAGIKVHTKFDLGKGIPETIVVTNAKEHDKSALEKLITEKNCIYIFDRAYVDYRCFDGYSQNDKYFISRLKNNALISEVKNLDITYCDCNHKLLDKDTEIIYDKIVYLGHNYNYKTKEKYRVIKIVDSQNREITFVTNIFNLSTEEISWLYKKRWEIELFFKWIKQNLKIKRFIGHSLNAVMMQIISAIMTFLMLKLIEKESITAFGLTIIKRRIKHCLSKKVNSPEFSWANFLGS